MVLKSNLVSLEEIGIRYPIILIDTSTLVCFLDAVDHKPVTLDLKNNRIDIELDSINLYRDYLSKKDNLFMIESIAEQFGNRGSVKKAIKHRGSYGGARNVLDYLRKADECTKQRNKLINLFYEKQKIIRLSDKEKEFYENFRIQNIHIKAKREIQDVGFEFLINGALLSKFRGDIALISNNYRIVGGWNDLYDGGEINNSVGFFDRRNLNVFKRLMHSCYLHPIVR